MAARISAGGNLKEQMVPVLVNETSADRLHRKLQEMLGDVAPDFELKLKADLAAEINQLKVQKNEIILAGC